jgi:hypothetical protein
MRPNKQFTGTLEILGLLLLSELIKIINPVANISDNFISRNLEKFKGALQTGAELVTVELKQT